jgi:hypothetical protein
VSNFVVESASRDTLRLQSLFPVILLILSLIGCSRSAFDQQHRRSVLANPTGVELEIHTRQDKKQFSVSEPVEFEEFYTSKYPGLWQIEVLEGQNTASSPSVDEVHITDGNAGWDQVRQPLVGIICCNSRHVWLNQEPTRTPYKLWSGPSPTNPDGWPNPQWQVLHLPNKPGNYRVYITTQRVFGHVVNNPYEDKGVAVSSNILNLRVK